MVDFLDRLAQGETVSLSRWGVREWHGIFGERQALDPHDQRWYLPQLATDLWNVLHARPSYCLSTPGRDKLVKAVDLFLSGSGLDGLDWIDDPLQHDGAGHALLEAIERSPLVVVGPPHLHRIASLQRAVFVNVPPRNAYLRRDDIVRATLAALEDMRCQTTVTLSAGVSTPLILDELHKREGKRHRLLDVGSLWERLHCRTTR